MSAQRTRKLRASADRTSPIRDVVQGFAIVVLIYVIPRTAKSAISELAGCSIFITIDELAQLADAGADLSGSAAGGGLGAAQFPAALGHYGPGLE